MVTERIVFKEEKLVLWFSLKLSSYLLKGIGFAGANALAQTHPIFNFFEKLLCNLHMDPRCWYLASLNRGDDGWLEVH